MSGIAIKIDGDSAIRRRVISLLRGECGSEKYNRLPGWREGKRKQSERALALICFAIDQLDSFPMKTDSSVWDDNERVIDDLPESAENESTEWAPEERDVGTESIQVHPEEPSFG